MGDFAGPGDPFFFHRGTHDLYHKQTGLAPQFASVAWTTANRARFLPIVVERSVEIDRLDVANGAVVNGNFDLGIYSADPSSAEPDVLIASIGSTAQAGTNVWQTVALGAAVTLGPSLYYLACAFDNNVGQVFEMLPGAATDIILNRLANCFEQTAAFPLPNPSGAVSVNSTDTLPLLGAFGREVL